MVKIVFCFIASCSLTFCIGPRKTESSYILLNPERPSVGCGILSVWVGMKFEKKSDGKQFIGLIQCPEFYDSAFFEPNLQYEIEFDTIIVSKSHNTLINNFEKEGLPVYPIKKIKLAE